MSALSTVLQDAGASFQTTCAYLLMALQALALTPLEVPASLLLSRMMWLFLGKKRIPRSVVAREAKQQ